MNVLRRRPITDRAALVALLADSLPELLPGVRTPARPMLLSDVPVDLAAVGGDGRLVLVLCELTAGPETLGRALAAAAWCAEHPAVVARAFPDLGDGAGLAPRAMVVATSFTESARAMLRRLGELAPIALAGDVYGEGGERALCLEELTATETASVEEAPAEPEASAPRPPAEHRPVLTPEQAEQAAELIVRLERLRFTEAFR